MSSQPARASRSPSSSSGWPLHNLVMAELWDAGVRGTSLDVVAAWKDVSPRGALAVAILSARAPPGAVVGRPARARLRGARRRSTGSSPRAGWTARATQRGQLFAARHDLIPVAAYFLGRLLVLTPVAWRRLSLLLVGVAVGLTSGASSTSTSSPCSGGATRAYPAGSRSSSGSSITGSRGLPENWVLNTGDEDNPIRRLVSTFLSPLATAYVLVIVLLYLVARRWTWWTHRRRASPTPAFSGRIRGRVPRARARARRPRPRPAPRAPCRPCCGLARRRDRVREGLPAHRPVDELHAGGARFPGGRRASSIPMSATTR